MNEIWKTLEIAPRYQISNLGNIKSSFTNRLLGKFDNGCGYLFVVMKNGERRLTRYVHRLVAQEFCAQSDSLKNCVNHIDGNKLNNTASNLEFCTYKENVHHAIRTGNGTSGNRKVPILGIREIFAAQDRKRDSVWAEEYGVAVSTIRSIRLGYTNAKHTESNEL